VYLSTFAYIDAVSRPAALRDAREQVFYSDQMVPHEVAHQWWGSVISTAHSEDEWLLEALANYSSLLWLEKKRGLKEMETVLNGYRSELLEQDSQGKTYESAGPIVWGDRLNSRSVGVARDHLEGLDHAYAAPSHRRRCSSSCSPNARAMSSSS
jgi:hypothetical protein